MAFNAVGVIACAIESVIRQPYPNIEYIVVDGGSTDGTLDILEHYSTFIDYWVSEPDRGIYSAMNKARQLACGDWLLFLGADDVLLPGFAEIVSALRNPNSVYYGNVKLRSSGVVYDGRFGRYKLMQQNICHQAILYPHSVYTQKSYSEDVGILADYKYNIEVWSRNGPFEYLPKIICDFNDTGRSSAGDLFFESIRIKLIRKNFGTLFYIIKTIRSFLVTLKPRQKP